MHIMALIDTELIYLEYTLIELRNNFHISIETEVRTHTMYHKNPDFAESANSIIESLRGID